MMHHLQKTIIRNLMHGDHVRFSDARPKGIDGNSYTYHLKQLVSEGYARKNDDGSYSLTEKGKHTAITSHLTQKEFIRQSHDIFLLVVHRDDGAWLLRKRRVQPAIGLIGLVHGEPSHSEPVLETARKRLRAKTGLDADFIPLSHGYIRIFADNELESFTHCTVFSATRVSGELISEDETGQNMWIKEPDFTDPSFLPSMPLIAQIVSVGSPPFFDKTFNL